MSDRAVHASFGSFEVVRYDRAGKWYIEETVPPHWRRQLTVAEAAQEAVAGRETMDGFIPLGIAGGRSFDREVERLERAGDA